MVEYECKICGNRVGVAVKLAAPPTCNNRKHKTRPTIMEQKK